MEEAEEVAVEEEEVALVCFRVFFHNKIILGYTSSDRAVAHGGERNMKKENDDGWDTPATESATIANTEDWASTAMKTSDQDWSNDVLDKEFEAKLQVGSKKGFTVVKVAPKLENINFLG